MKIFAISDLHLSFAPYIEKPMNIFGSKWEKHEEKLEEYWRKTVMPEDVVLVGGDTSWGLKLDDAIYDLDWIDKLPGSKILIKGNHDLWWSSITKMNSLYPGMKFLQSNFFEVGDFAICGSRGWVCPGAAEFTLHDEKIYNREIIRLRLSLEMAKKAGKERIIGMLHYPPTNDSFHKSGFTELFTEFGVERVIYGHLHGKDNFVKGFKGEMNGVFYDLTSYDYLNAKPICIWSDEKKEVTNECK
ncbi:MAG: metallophosphoesterase [Eubacteriales bacterium]